MASAAAKESTKEAASAARITAARATNHDRNAATLRDVGAFHWIRHRFSHGCWHRHWHWHWVRNCGNLLRWRASDRCGCCRDTTDALHYLAWAVVHHTFANDLAIPCFGRRRNPLYMVSTRTGAGGLNSATTNDRASAGTGTEFSKSHPNRHNQSSLASVQLAGPSG